jgi:uncharacterized protein
MSDAQAAVDAAKAGDLARMKALIADDPAAASAVLSTGETPVMAALYRGHHHIVSALVEAGARVDLFAAAALGRLDDLDRGLQTAGHVNDFSYDGWTSLHLAAFFGQLDAARRVLDAGASVSAVSRNSLRNTPLHAATAGGHGDVALLLIERGADVGVADAAGHTPLHIAAENGLLAVVRALLARGADPLAVDGEDKTPLSRAAARNRTDVIDELNRLR